MGISDPLGSFPHNQRRLVLFPEKVEQAYHDPNENQGPGQPVSSFVDFEKHYIQENSRHDQPFQVSLHRAFSFGRPKGCQAGSKGKAPEGAFSG
jgi:hypothetical protein